MVVQIIDAVWKGAKFTTQHIIGMTKIAFSPNDPIPPSKLHPRMPPYPSTLGEFLRLYSWRHNWRSIPRIRYMIIFTPVVIWFLFHYIPSGPRGQELSEMAGHKLLSAEHIYRHKTQRDQDKLYFQKYDPLRKVRKEMIEYKL